MSLVGHVLFDFAVFIDHLDGTISKSHSCNITRTFAERHPIMIDCKRVKFHPLGRLTGAKSLRYRCGSCSALGYWQLSTPITPWAITTCYLPNSGEYCKKIGCWAWVLALRSWVWHWSPWLISSPCPSPSAAPPHCGWNACVIRLKPTKRSRPRHFSTPSPCPPSPPWKTTPRSTSPTP